MATNKDFKIKNGIAAGGAVTGSNLSGTNTGDQTITLTGDITGSGTGSFGATLASTGVSAGTYSSVAVDTKGRVTAGAALVGDVTTSAGTATLASIGTSGTKGSASAVPVFVTDAKGRVTSSADTTIQIAETQVTDGSLLARNAGNETISGNWTFSNVVVGADPTLSAHLATKQYVDNIASGLDVKSSVRAASTANLTLSGTQTVDGVALIAGDRVLAKDQTTGANNGIYVVASGAWARSSDADASAEVTSGLYTFVEEGTANADTGWLLTTVAPITLGTTSLSFAQFTGLGQITAGAGLSKTGSTLSLNTTLTGLTSVTSTSFVGALTGNASTVTTNANLTGDVTSSGNATTLATVNSNTGALGSSTAIPTITTNGKGLVTAVTTNAVVAPAGTLTGSTLASGVTGSSLTSVGTLGSLAVTSTNSTGSLIITDAGTSGANLKLTGNGATPNKYIRSQSGNLEFVNSAYGAVILTVTDAGAVTAVGAVTGSNLSGTNTGDQTTVSGNAGTATALQTGRTLAVTGDLTWTSPSFNGSANITAAGTLATVNSNVGAFGSGTSIPTLTVNGKGLVTAASGNAVVAPAGTLSGSTLASGVTSSSLTSVGTLGSLAVTSTNSTGTLVITDTGTSGANIKLAGNGATTPNKYVRAQGGKLSVVNSGYTLEIASIDDSGNLVVAGNLTSSGTSSAVNWLQSGTGAVTRTMSSKLQDVVSAKDFGATGDGSTDDTTAIQAAINFVQSHTNVGSSVSPYLGPQVLYIPAGYYLVSAPLTITGAITIRGDKSSEFSSGTRLHKTTAGDLFTCTAAGGGLSFSLEELCLDSTGVSGSGYLVNMVSGSQNHNSSRLYHCVFSNPQNFAIRATADDLHIDTCTFDVSPFNSIQLGSLTGSDICSDLLVSNCNWYNITDTIFLAYQYRNVRITGCQVSNPTTPIYTKHFFDAATGSPSLAIGLSITGCCMDFVRQILALSNTSNTCFTGNSCYGVGNGSSETLDSILLTNTNVDVAITGNVISGSYGVRSAINNTGGSNLNALTVTGNVFRSAGSLGTALTLGAGVGIVMGNYYNGFLASLSSSNSQVISGNAGTATALQTARTINGTSFDGTANVTVTAAAGTLTGTTLASGVTSSSLTSVGTLGSLALASTNSTGTLAITDTGSSGANIKLTGDGATTPNKYVRAQGGKLSVVNSAYSAEIASIDDSGNLVAAGGMTAQAGNVIANGFVPTSSTVVSNGMYLIAANTLALSTNGAEKLRLDASGNLGVLTLTPPCPLSVALNQSGSFGVGNSWSNRTAVIGVATSGTSGNHGFAYDNAQGASIISIEPSVAWHPIGYHASQHNFSISGNATAVIGSNGLGYAAGAGSAVTQATSRGTNVTINAVCGAITMFSAAGFYTAPTSFTVNNTKVAATDTVVLSQKSGTNQYALLVSAVATGSFTITFYTAPGQTATDAPVINFAVIKAVMS